MRWLTLCVPFWLSSALSLPASDYYVDVVNGNDVTGNGSPGKPWASITRALQVVITPGDRLHVADGVYDESSGERFPIRMNPGVAVIGGGWDVSRIYGPPDTTVVRFPASADFPPTTVLRGFTIWGGLTAVEILGGPGLVTSPVITQNLITGSTCGLLVDGVGGENRTRIETSGVYADSQAISGHAVWIRGSNSGRVELQGVWAYAYLGNAVYVESDAGPLTVESTKGFFANSESEAIRIVTRPGGNVSATIDGNFVSASAGIVPGLFVYADGSTGPAFGEVTVTRNAIVSSSAGVRILATEGGTVDAHLSNNHIDDNTVGYGAGILSQSRSGGAITISSVNDTITNNVTGLQIEVGTTFTGQNALIWGNAGSSVLADGPMSLSYSDVEGGFPGSGNLDQDPLLGFPGSPKLGGGSPCIDSANGDVAPAADWSGRARWDDPATPNRGVGSPPCVDMGCAEFFPDIDTDGDTRADPWDNCPNVANRPWEDTDFDGTGDACDPCTDTDEDGFGNPGFPANTCPDDNCPTLWNPPQTDLDGDTLGDACDPDADGDGDAKRTDCDDLDPFRSHLLAEDCGNGIDDDCDGWADGSDPDCGAPDTDGDTIPDPADNCPSVANPGQSNLDGDTLGDACDPDADGDGVEGPLGTGEDCNDLSPGEKRIPGEVDNLLASRPGGQVVLVWDEKDKGVHGADLAYDVLGGVLGPGPWNPSDPYATPSCDAANLPTATATLSVSGSQWFLVRAGLPTCGEGTYGDSTILPDPRDRLDSDPTCP